MLDVLKEYLTDAPVHRVKQHGLLVQHQIGVVGDAARNGVDVLKQRQAAVTAAHPIHILCNLLYAMHVVVPPFPGDTVLQPHRRDIIDAMIIAYKNPVGNTDRYGFVAAERVTSTLIRARR